MKVLILVTALLSGLNAFAAQSSTPCPYINKSGDRSNPKANLNASVKSKVKNAGAIHQ